MYDQSTSEPLQPASASTSAPSNEAPGFRAESQRHLPPGSPTQNILSQWRRTAAEGLRRRSVVLASGTSNAPQGLLNSVGSVSFHDEAGLHMDSLRRMRTLPGLHGRCEHAWWVAQGWLLAIGIGVVSSLSGCLIDVSTRVLASFRGGFCNSRPLAPHEWCPEEGWTSWGTGVFGISMYIGLGVLMAIFSALLCHLFAPAATGSGIPEVKTILNGFVLPDVVALRTVLVKVPGLALSVAAGMSLGKEGPLVHVAVCWAQLLSALFPQFQNEGKRREMFSAAAAAGVSTAFGAPLGGVLFSLEEVSSHFPNLTLLRSFTAAVVAALVLSVANLTGSGRLTIFSVELNNTLHPGEFVVFALLGVLGGLVGAFFNALNARWSAFRMQPGFRRRVHPVLEVALLALVTTASSWPLTITRPLSSEAIHAMFGSCTRNTSTPWSREMGLCTSEGAFQPDYLKLAIYLAIAAALRFFQMVLTFGTACPAGLFVPSLFIGACLGRCVGVLFQAANSNLFFFKVNVEPGVYAMVGAAAVLGGVCRVTISLVVIMLELTGDLTDVVPFMLAVLVSKMVGDVLNEGIYDLYIMLKGYPFLAEDPDITFTERCCDIMDTNLITLDLETPLTVADVQRLLRDYAFRGFPVVVGCRFLGYILRRRLQEIVENLGDEDTSQESPEAQLLESLHAQTDQSVMRMVPDAPLTQAHKVFGQLGFRHIFIVSSQGKAAQDALQGILSKKKYIRFLQSGEVGHMPDHPRSMPVFGRQVSGGSDPSPIFSARAHLAQIIQVRDDSLHKSQQDDEMPAQTSPGGSMVSLRDLVDDLQRHDSSVGPS